MRRRDDAAPEKTWLLASQAWAWCVLAFAPVPLVLGGGCRLTARCSMLSIPNDWRPRPHQLGLYNNFGYAKRYQRASVIWHRRAGKDSTALNLTAREMFKRAGTYWHLFPEQAQARKAIWNGVDGKGRRIIDQFLPLEVRTRTSGQEMLIALGQGAIWQMAGSDNYDSLVGSNPIGVVFTEWALANPLAWEYIRPILLENGGWALFITTPRGRNHAYKMHQMALHNDAWFADLATYRDTGILSDAQIQQERDAGMSESKIQSEYFCSFEAETDEQFIPTHYVQAAQSGHVQTHIGDPMVLGVDVARFGDDMSVIYPRRGRDARTMPIEVYAKLDTMQLAGKVAEAIAKYTPDGVFIDEGGVGAGVIDRLRQLGFSVVGINFGAASDQSMGSSQVLATNKRSEIWGAMREWLRRGGLIPAQDQKLEFELLSPLYSYDAHNAIVLEKKADMKKRGIRSPDIADALALTFSYPVVPRSIARGQEQEADKNYDPIWGEH